MKRSLLGWLLSRLFRVLPAKSRVLSIIFRSEGGHFYSLSAREVLRKYYGIVVGPYSYGALLDPGMADPGTTIGNYVSIGPNVRRFGAAHPTDHTSLHPFWYNARLGFVGPESDVSRSEISIGADCWIGANVTILPGCRKIGVGAVVGAGAVVTRDVDDFTIVAGNPARVIGTRLSERQRLELLARSPWDHPPAAAREILEAIQNINEPDSSV